MSKLVGLKGIHNISETFISKDYEYAIKVYNYKIEKSISFYIGLEFEETTDPRKEILTVEKWDGVGGESTMRVREYN